MHEPSTSEHTKSENISTVSKNETPESSDDDLSIDDSKDMRHEEILDPIEDSTKSCDRFVFEQIKSYFFTGTKCAKMPVSPGTDTLSMVSTPWSTETWNSFFDSDDDKTDVSEMPSFQTMSNSKEIRRSKLASSYSMSCIALRQNRSTSLLFCVPPPSIDTSCSYIPNIPIKKSKSETLSSWTLETFTSTGLSFSKTNLTKRCGSKEELVWNDVDGRSSCLDTMAWRNESIVHMVDSTE